MDEEKRQLVVVAAVIVYVMVAAAGFGGVLGVPASSTSCGPLTIVASFSWSATSLSVVFTDTSPCTGSSATYFWNFGDGGSASGFQATHVYAAAGTFSVVHTLKVVLGPSTKTVQATQSVTVYAPTDALSTTFTYTNPAGSGTVSFSSSAGGGTPPYAFAWDFGDGKSGTGSSPSHTYANPGTYAVSLRVTDAKANTASASKAISVSGGASFTPSFTYTVVGLKISLLGSCTGCASSLPSYSWTFGDGSGSVGGSVTHTYAVKGTYNVTLTVTDSTGVASSVTKQIAVAPVVQPSIGYTANYLQVFFNGSATGGTGTYSSWSWTFGDSGPGSSSQNPTHTYAAAGTYSVSLTATDSSGTTGTVTRSLAISGNSTGGALLVSFTASPNGLSVAFTGSALGGSAPYTYLWAFGDSGVSIQQSPSHAYAAAGNYTVSLTVKDSMGTAKTATEVVSVSGPPAPPPPGPTGSAPGLPDNLPFFVAGLVALAAAVVFSIPYVETLEEREKWIVGGVAFAAGVVVLVFAGIASPYVPKPF